MRKNEAVPTCRALSGAQRGSKRTIATFLLGFALQVTVCPRTSSADAPIEADQWAAAMGKGFDSHLGHLAKTCVNGTLQYRGNRVGTLTAHYNDSFADFLSITSGRLSGGVNLLLIGGSAAVDYYARVSRTELSTSYTSRFESTLSTAVLTDRSLSTEGAAAAAQPPTARRLACGDEFVSEAVLGSELLITAAFHFTNSSEFQRFVTSVTVEALFGLIKSTKRWVDETSSFSQSGYLKVEALQRGGDPAALATIMGATQQSLCRFDDVEACRSLLLQLLQYAGSSSGYRSQFSVPYQPEQLALIGYRTTRYEDSGHDDLVVPPPGPEDADIPMITRTLAIELARQIAVRDRAALMLSTPISDQRRLEIRDIQARSDANVSNIEGVLWICRTSGSPAECRAARDQESSRRYPIASTELYM